MNLRTLTTLLALTLLGTAAWAAPLPQGTRGPKTTEFKAAKKAVITWCASHPKVEACKLKDYFSDRLIKECGGTLSITGNQAQFSVQCQAGGILGKLTFDGEWKVTSVEDVPGGE
jgi:hypothetical protein